VPRTTDNGVALVKPFFGLTLAARHCTRRGTWRKRRANLCGSVQQAQHPLPGMRPGAPRSNLDGRRARMGLGRPDGSVAEEADELREVGCGGVEVAPAVGLDGDDGPPRGGR
jgi:hypothetical protein